ncbi:MAG: hypothetical protein KJO38_07295 [Gammaproteobacteria bacterium]|nr:hypothetical protein [Gammaproteobacteria bacterium]
MKPLELELRASLFAQLAVLDDAGVAAATACSAVAGNAASPFAEAARRTARALTAGARRCAFSMPSRCCWTGGCRPLTR